MTAERPPDGLDPELLARIHDLQTTLKERDDEIGKLKLQLDVLTTVDRTTGLLSRNGAIDAIKVSLLRLDRQTEPFAVVVFRIPGLTDMLGGDDTTDDVLRSFAALFAAGLRELDRKARIDTDTFAAVLPFVTAVDMPSIIDRLEMLLVGTPVAQADRRLKPRPQFAAVMVSTLNEKDPEKILDRAVTRAGEATRDAIIDSI